MGGVTTENAACVTVRTTLSDRAPGARATAHDRGFGVAIRF